MADWRCGERISLLKGKSASKLSMPSLVYVDGPADLRWLTSWASKQHGPGRRPDVC